MISRRIFITTGGAEGLLLAQTSNITVQAQSLIPSDPTYWWWWTGYDSWNSDRHNAYPDLPVIIDDGSSSGSGFSWPADDDETNYTIFTEEMIRTKIAHYRATVGPPSYNFCTVVNGLAAFTLAEAKDYLRKNPAILAELVLLTELAPEIIFLIGSALIVMFIVLAGFC